MSSPLPIPKFSFSFTRPDPNEHKNRLPAALETSLLNQLILSRRNYLAAIDDEIGTTLTLSSHLQEEISEMETRLDEKRSMLALLHKALNASNENREKVLRDMSSLSTTLPIVRRLPDEVLLNIFLEAVKLEEDERRALALEWRSYALGKIPLTLSGVCARWRSIILGTPAMWRFLNLVSQGNDSTTLSPVINHWFTYGPLNASVSLDGWKEDHQFFLPAPLITTFAGERRILPRIEVSCLDQASFFNSDWPVVYPLAKEVVIISDGSEGICDFFVPLITRAEKLVLSGVKAWWSDSNWDSLTDLTLIGFRHNRLSPLRASDVLELFTLAPNLNSLDIFWDPSRTEHTTSKPGPASLVHAEFRSLTCPFEAIDTYLSSLQHSLVFPSIHMLKLKTLPLITPSLLRGWRATLSAMEICPLRVLDLPTLHEDAIDHLIFLFTFLPMLERLILTGRTVDNLLQRLIIEPTEQSAILLPALSELELRDGDITGWTLLRLIASRMKKEATGQVGRISRVDLWECPRVQPFEWKRVQVLLKEDLESVDVRDLLEGSRSIDPVA